jgi:mono/diheme cytochrome c family protein
LNGLLGAGICFETIDPGVNDMTIRIWVAAILAFAAMGVTNSVLRAQASHSVKDGVYTDEQAKHGNELYNANCAVCHGDTLGGGEEAPPLAGADFISNWNGLTVGDLFERMSSSMPLNKPQSLSRETNAAILAYILSVNKFPVGQSELSSHIEALKQIRIDAPQ